MARIPSSPACEVVACEICLTEIPRDLAKSEEATEYVHYFCGDACFVKWKESEGDTGSKPPARR